MIHRVFAFLLCAAGLATSAFGYGNAGHEMVGNLAEHYIQGTPAEAQVKKLLHQGETLAKACTWADRAKFPDDYLSPEMKDFVANNPDHHSLHFCDIPFQEKAYHDGGTGTNPADIVHTMKLCIDILKNPAPAPENPRHLTKRVAFLLLVHLAGDIHQPLHVGTSYMDSKNQFVDPDQGGKGQEDAGANYFKITSKVALHGYWDTIAVKNAKEKAGGEDFTAFMIAHHPPNAAWKSQGPVNTWPQQWATDTLQLSRQCYTGIKLTNRHTVPADEKHPAHDEWDVKLPPGYDEMAAKVVELELAKAGYRLAEMLKAIWPAN